MDHAWLDRELDDVTEELCQAFPALPEDQVTEVVQDTINQLLPARVESYLPILVWRRAYARLETGCP